MAYKNIFENEEFDKKIKIVKQKISNYLSEKSFELKDMDVDSLLGWHDMPSPRMVYASERCPAEIKNIVTQFIQEEFPIS